MSNMIPLSGMSVAEFTPAQLLDHKPKPVFFIRTPTFAIKDKMAAILYERGFMPATMSQSRGILIDALYKLYPEAEADDHATFLESYWTRAEVHEEIVQAWQLREVQRIFDVAQGVPRDKVEQEPLPPAPFTMREQARQAAILTYVMQNNDDYRSYQARFMVAQEEEDEMIMRIFLLRWENCGDAVAERDSMDLLTLECIERLRQWLADEGATNAWDAIKQRVKGQFGAPGGLEKNSGSPLDTNSSLIGSQMQSGASETSDGSSTTSSIEAILDSDLQAISGGSRNSPSAKPRKRKPASAARRKSGRTAAVS